MSEELAEWYLSGDGVEFTGFFEETANMSAVEKQRRHGADEKYVKCNMDKLFCHTVLYLLQHSPSTEVNLNDLKNDLKG